MTDTLRRVTLTAVTGLGLCLTLLPAGQAQAQAPTRVPCGDVAALKTAISDANTNGGTIALAPRCTYSLTAADNPDDGLPEITGKVRITGDRTTVQRAPSAAASFRVFHVTQGGSLSLDSLTVRGGDASGSGFAAGGGGIFNDQGRLTLTDATVRDNNAGFLGGGLWNNGGTLVLKNTTVRDNETQVAGGVATTGTMTMRGGSLRDNTASFWGGGLGNAGDTTLNNVSVDGNNVGEGNGGLGGGIMTMSISSGTGTQTGPLRLNSTQVRDNIAENSGGGIFIGFEEPTTLYKSVVTRNTANGGPEQGGGINNDGGRFGVIIRPTGSSERQQSKAGASAKQTLPEVNLIRSAVFKNHPTNCAPPGSVPRCDAVGSAPATNTPQADRS
ncbi:right-handed parallel beta-helix repeat-containing protein [Streptomyces ovatisporus]|uniref:Right-handed parallel beta-helix repeat-containing protein n=1 Tax=Streptomyces ovatisporus TaxID=1128682 RepID=A0ABV9A877_9ACTN